MDAIIKGMMRESRELLGMKNMIPEIRNPKRGWKRKTKKFPRRQIKKIIQKWKTEEKVRELIQEAQYFLEDEERERERASRLYQSEFVQQTQFTFQGSDKEILQSDSYGSVSKKD